MKTFGWDLRELEKRNQLRVVSMKPDVLLKQMKTPHGLFEQMIGEINAKRIVVDSISLLQYGNKNQEENREALYSLRNIFRKFNLTALLLSEQTHSMDENIPFERYVADGVVKLSLDVQMAKFRKRTLEILKMRGTRIVEGEHIYRITSQGIHLVPALSMVEDVVISNHQQLSTGIRRLDKMLSGGIPKGSVFILDTNSKANYKFLFGSIISRRIMEGDKIIALLSSLKPPAELQDLVSLYGIDLQQITDRNDICFIEHYNRPIPQGFDKAVIYVKDMPDEEFRSFYSNKLTTVLNDSLESKTHCFVYLDLDTIFFERGTEFVKRFFAEEAARARSIGITILALCNFTEIGVETSSYLERTANGVIRTWVDGNYQYLQVAKAPSGRMTEPHLVENITDKPYIQLV
jgi:circadian clock protein KaiC